MIDQCRRHEGIRREGCVWSVGANDDIGNAIRICRRGKRGNGRVQNFGAVLLMIKGQLQDIICCPCLAAEAPWSIVVLPGRHANGRVGRRLQCLPHHKDWW